MEFSEWLHQHQFSPEVSLDHLQNVVDIILTNDSSSGSHYHIITDLSLQLFYLRYYSSWLFEHAPVGNSDESACYDVTVTQKRELQSQTA